MNFRVIAGAVKGWALGALLAIPAAELTTRWLITSPSNQVFDEETGFVYAPNSTIFRGSEGGSYLQLNALGMNADAIDKTSLSSKPTTLVLGDSLTEALQLPRPYNFVEQLNQLVPDRLWLNAGRSGVGPAHYAAIIKRYKHLSVDRVLLVVGRGDGADLLRSDVVESMHNGQLRIRTKPSTKDGLKKRLEPLLRQSAAATHMGRRLLPVMKSFAQSKPSQTPPWEEASKHEATVYRRLHAVLSELKPMRPIEVTYLPEVEYKADRQATLARSWEASLVRAVCQDLEIPFIELFPALKDHYQQTGQPGHGFANLQIGYGHLNRTGHRVAARALASQLAVTR